MLVKDVMTRHPIMISPETSAAEAQRLMAENNIRHLPVTGRGKRLEGLISQQSFALRADVLGSLDVWEISRYLSGLSVKDLMTPAEKVRIIDPDRTIEHAARVMTDHKVNGMPVIEDDVVVGIISEVDLLEVVQKMLAIMVEGVRVTLRMPNVPGEFHKMSAALGDFNNCVMAIATYPAPRRDGFYEVVIKFKGVTQEQVREALSNVPGQEIIDLRASN